MERGSINRTTRDKNLSVHGLVSTHCNRLNSHISFSVLIKTVEMDGWSMCEFSHSYMRKLVQEQQAEKIPWLLLSGILRNLILNAMQNSEQIVSDCDSFKKFILFVNK